MRELWKLFKKQGQEIMKTPLPSSIAIFSFTCLFTGLLGFGIYSYFKINLYLKGDLIKTQQLTIKALENELETIKATNNKAQSKVTSLEEKVTELESKIIAQRPRFIQSDGTEILNDGTNGNKPIHISTCYMNIGQVTAYNLRWEAGFAPANNVAEFYKLIPKSGYPPIEPFKTTICDKIKIGSSIIDYNDEMILNKRKENKFIIYSNLEYSTSDGKLYNEASVSTYIRGDKFRRPATETEIDNLQPYIEKYFKEN